MLSSMYDQALDGGYKTWVLTGFQQGTLLQAWFNEGDNLQKFKDEKIVVVGVDWNGETFMPKGQFLGLGFKTEEPSWVVGYAASKFLSTTDKPYLSSFGGGIFDGVTDFNNGFLQGMLDWNTENPLKKVKFYSGNKPTSSINLNTGFVITPEAMQTIEGIVGIGEDVSCSS
jgi:basic membrane lipoprotein Med (substrate-binding protein (PBP1-ABC) superfamily)